MKSFLPPNARLTPGRIFPARASRHSEAARILTVSFDASSAERQIEIKLNMKTRPLFKPAHSPIRLGNPFVVRRATVAPSLRLHATKANRSLLRWMRAAEQAAWQDTELSAASITE